MSGASTRHSRRRSPLGLSVWLVCAALAAGITAAGADNGRDEPVYVHEDAVLAAKQMHTFADKGVSVNVLLGDFSLTLGRQSLAGRDAVLWLTERPVGERVLREIELYIEGDVKITEADGTVTTDQSVFVRLRQEGGMRVRVQRHSGKGLEMLPIMARAEEARRRVAARPVEPAEPPLLIKSTAPPGPRPPPLAGRAPETKPAPAPPAAVSFRADNFTSEEIADPRDPTVKWRVTIAKGGIYVAQGSPDREGFMEMQAEAAVAYSAPGSGIGSTPERIVGAYLEGNVRVRRGERTVRGQRLFYDFTTGRAIILKPVFRTIQEQRNVPVYIRAEEGRQLAVRDEGDPDKPRLQGSRWYFRDAIVTTSDFVTPEYSIAAKRVYFEDTTPYDPEGVRLDQPSWRTKLEDATFNIASVPVLWAPRISGDAEQGHTALRRAQVSRHGRFGWGAETEWNLFRLLGMPKPEGVSGRLEADWYERGAMLGVKLDYDRPGYAGHVRLHGLWDDDQKDEFGTRRKNIPAPEQRGWFQWRHKQFLPRDWQVQFETSYLCDENFLEEFFPGEFWSGKEQENLLYAKKQVDNRALTVLAKWRLNDFLTQTEAYPDVAGYIIGQSFWDDHLTYYGEGRAGVVRFRPGSGESTPASDASHRGDMRHEVQWPLMVGPVKIVPNIVARLTGWGDSIEKDGTPHAGSEVRPYAQAGLTAQTHFWRVDNFVESRLWDLHGMKHIITPYVAAFYAGTDVEPDRLYPFDPGIEQHVEQLGGATVGVRQLWQTKRGPEGNRHTADWLRLDVYAAGFTDPDRELPADGRYFISRPEYSLARNAINAEAAWHVSDSTTVLVDTNYDVDSARFARFNAGVAVARSPRLEYFAGLRHFRDIDSSVGTLGFNYRINRKYSLSVFEQFDFKVQAGGNLITSAMLVRKFPRFYTGLTIVVDQTQQDVGVIFSVWPEGIPELNFGGSRASLMGARMLER